MDQPRILVTGATGFIGQYVLSRLLVMGHRVIASSAHPEKAENQPWYSQVEYVPFDLLGFDPAVDHYRLLGSPDLMIHLAWEGLPDYKGAFHLEKNYPRHAAFLQNMISHGLRDLTVTGTCFEYGMREGCLDEAMQAHPDNAYARGKDALRTYLQTLERQYPFVFRWARLFYMYGKGQNPKSLLSLLDKALDAGEQSFNMSGGEQVRDFLPVEKVAEYVVGVALQQRVTGIINICSGHPITVRQLVEAYLQRRGQSITLNLGYYPYPDYEPMRFWGNNEKLLKTISEDE